MFDVYAEHYEWLQHSLAPKPTPHVGKLRVLIGSGPKAYSASLLNIFAMSYRALSANAVRPLTVLFFCRAILTA